MKQSYKTAVLWVFLIVVFATIWQTVEGPEKGDQPSFSEFIQKTYDGKVAKITVNGPQIEGVYTEAAGGETFKTVGEIPEPIMAEFMEKKRNIQVTYSTEGQDNFWLSVMSTWLPMIFLFLIFFFFMRQLQSGGGKAMSFGKSRHKLMNESTKKVTFADIAGIDEAKAELGEIIDFLREPKKYTRLGGRIPKGVLLMGPPGTGKTLLARGVAGEAGVPFFSISGSDFVEMFVGVGASRVRDLFEQGKKNAPCIVFIDEIDAVGRHRGAGLGGGHDEREQTLNQLLVEMDGFDSNEGVILMAATNRPDVLDPALLRPGRFDRRVVVERPDVKGRFGILKVHTRKVPLAPFVDLEIIARGTPGFTGADLENLVNEAALLAGRLDKKKVGMDDFESAKDKVLMGTERRSIVISEDEKKNTAYHEAGHTLVAHHLESADPVHKVTIIPRGRAMGLTQQLPNEDRYSYDDQFVQHRIAVLMGGRVAEEIKFGRKTTGAGNDIEQATSLARKMVCEWGMSSLGTISYGKSSENPFVGRDMNGGTPEYSESTGELLDREVRRIITAGYKRARDLLETHIEQLESLSQALLDFETLGGEEIGVAIEGGDVGEFRAKREAEQEAAMAGGERARQAAAEEADRNPTVSSGGSDTAEGMA